MGRSGTTTNGEGFSGARRPAVRRTVVLALLASLGTLGFLQGSAVGGHATAKSQAVFPTSPGGIISSTVIKTLPPTVTTTTSTTPTLTIVTLPVSLPTLTLVTSTSTTSSTTSTTTTTTSTASTASTISSTSTAATTSGSLPTISVATTTTSAAFIPPPDAKLSVAVSGNGSVTGSNIVCGAKGSKCYGTFKPGTQVTLHAGPSAGSKFSGWSGGCSGHTLVCLVKISKVATVVATFSPAGGTAVPVAITKADFDVRWAQSMGSGKLDVTGRIGKPALVAIQLHRSGGRKVLLTANLSLPAGPFSFSIKLSPGLLADGLPLLPGGFVVSINGKSGKLVVPTQVRTISLTPPPQGVVLNAYASTSAKGRPTASIPSSKRAAFVHFVFQSLPSEKQPLTVAWYRPGGKLLGVADKPNAPDVTSSISSKAPLPTGSWRVDLRAGKTVVKSIPIQVK